MCSVENRETEHKPSPCPSRLDPLALLTLLPAIHACPRGPPCGCSAKLPGRLDYQLPEPTTHMHALGNAPRQTQEAKHRLPSRQQRTCEAEPLVPPAPAPSPSSAAAAAAEGSSSASASSALCAAAAATLGPTMAARNATCARAVAGGLVRLVRLALAAGQGILQGPRLRLLRRQHSATLLQQPAGPGPLHLAPPRPPIAPSWPTQQGGLPTHQGPNPRFQCKGFRQAVVAPAPFQNMLLLGSTQRMSAQLLTCAMTGLPTSPKGSKSSGTGTTGELGPSCSPSPAPAACWLPEGSACAWQQRKQRSSRGLGASLAEATRAGSWLFI